MDIFLQILDEYWLDSHRSGLCIGIAKSVSGYDIYLE